MALLRHAFCASILRMMIYTTLNTFLCRAGYIYEFIAAGGGGAALSFTTVTFYGKNPQCFVWWQI